MYPFNMVIFRSFLYVYQRVQFWPFTSYKYQENPIYNMYNPTEITSYNL